MCRRRGRWRSEVRGHHKNAMLHGIEGEGTGALMAPEDSGSLTYIIEDLERQLIVKALREHGGSQTAAAMALGLKRSTLRYKLEKYGLVSADLGE